jgi:hypothetical protein
MPGGTMDQWAKSLGLSFFKEMLPVVVLSMATTGGYAPLLCAPHPVNAVYGVLEPAGWILSLSSAFAESLHLPIEQLFGGFETRQELVGGQGAIHHVFLYLHYLLPD